ncbi:MAG: hypothetical protein ACI9EF_000296 [Pseudohongiellaceae bacterium]|jgi:hypothetical protein
MTVTALRVLGVVGALVLAGALWWAAFGEQPLQRVDKPPPEALPVSSSPPAETLSGEQPVLAAPGAEPEQLPVSAPAPVTLGVTVEIVAYLSVPNTRNRTPVATRLELGSSSSQQEFGEPLQVIETDTDGRAVVELAWELIPAPVNGEQAWLWIRSEGPGLLSRVASRRVPKESGQSVTLSLRLQPGVIVEGRIIGPDGEPARGTVDSWSFDDTPFFPRRSLGKAGADGLFSGELTAEGTHGLLAKAYRASRSTPEKPSSARQLGTGFSDLFEVSFDAAVPFIEVHVSGPGVLKGRVLDATGAPAAAVRLSAVVASIDDEASDTAIPYSQTFDLEQEGRGLAQVWMTTDTQGAFEATGLRDDLFNIHAAGNERFSAAALVLLTPQSVPSHGQPLELQLTRPHLAIHVTQADGSPPPKGFRRLYVDSITSQLDEWPDEPRLLVTLARGDVPSENWRDAYPEAQTTGPGEFIVELEDDVTVFAGVLGGDMTWQPLTIVVPAGAGRIDVELVMPEPAVHGTLVLDVLDSLGAPVLREVQVRVSDPTSGVILFNKPFTHTDEEDWPLRLTLPDGQYQLLVEGHAWVERRHGTVMTPRNHGRFEQQLLISPAHETHVTAVLSAGARLSLNVYGVPTEADRLAVRDWDPRDDSDEYVESWAPRVELRLQRPGHWPDPVNFRRRKQLFSSMHMGSEGLSEMLSPGDYTLVATTTGGRTIRREVQLIAGQTLAVSLRFD